MEEVATLEGAGAPSDLAYQLSISSGLSPHPQPDGSIAMLDERGATWFTIPAPIAFPRAVGVSAGRALPMSISASGSGWLVSVDTGEPWLRQALASGPVVVDPTVKLKSSVSCELAAESPKTSYCKLSSMHVGYDATHQEHHALVFFPMTSIPGAAVILHATLGLDLVSHSTANAKAVGVYRVTKPWTNSATWETYDGTHAWSTPGGDYANPSENSDASVNPSVGAANGWCYWYPTKMVQEWVNGPNAPANEGYENDGLIVKDVTDNQTPNLLLFDSTGSLEAENPYLEVAYEPRGEGSDPQYTMLSTPLTDRSTMSVNVASGDLMIQANDLQIAGVAGLNFTSNRTWNSLNTDIGEYGKWTDSNVNENELRTWPDGTVAIQGTSGGWFTFIRQSNASFITPPGIKAVMCESGSPSPCPASLPSGTKYRLAYDASGDYVDYDSEGLGSGVHDRFGNTISAEYPSRERANYTDTHGHKIEEFSNKDFFITEIKDVSGSRNTKYTYNNDGSSSLLETYTDADGKVTSPDLAVSLLE